MKRVLVLMGGPGSEREVSLQTGENIYKHLNRNLFEVTKLVVPIEGEAWVDELIKLKPTTVFVGLHGQYGEGGTVQRILDGLGIRYTGSGVRASEIGIDKLRFRREIGSLGIIMPQVYDEKDIQFPCVVKPVSEGSSIGITLVKDQSMLGSALVEAKRYGEIMVEEYIEGLEVSCGVMGNNKLTALPVIEIRPKMGSFFNYDSKYQKGGSEEIVPAKIMDEVRDVVQKQALEVYQTIGCRGYGRVDFILKNTVPYLLEINTLPGMTETSLLPQEAAAMGIDYQTLLTKILELTEEN